MPRIFTRGLSMGEGFCNRTEETRRQPEKLFEQATLSTLLQTQAVWRQVCCEEQSTISRDLDFLTTRQKQLLATIATQNGITEPSGKQFVSQVNLTPKGVR